MCSLIINNAFSLNINDCPKTIYLLSIVKKYAISASNVKNLSECKYYVLNSSILIKKIKYKGINCECFELLDIQIGTFLDKAENATNINECKKHANKTVSKLNLFVNNIINCNK